MLDAKYEQRSTVLEEGDSNKRLHIPCSSWQG